MRVTKLIREYVEKSVKAMPKFAEPTPEEVEYKNFSEKVTKFAESIEAEMKHAIQEAIDNFRAVNGIGTDVDLRPYEYNIVRYTTWNCDLAKKANLAKQKREAACREAINEVLLSLELGADRKELEDMLNTLREEA